MTTAPPSIAALPAAPDPNNRATFNTLAYPWAAALPTFGTQVSDLGANVKANADEAVAAAVIAVANASQAVAAAGVTLWVSGTNYTAGISYVVSPVDLKTYQRIVSGAGATDPGADATNWRVVDFGLVRTIVTATTQSASAGNNYWLANVAATTVIAPSATDGAKFRVTPVNGLLTNAIDFGAATVRGYGGRDMTGVVTLDMGIPVEFEYSTTIGKWVMA